MKQFETQLAGQHWTRTTRLQCAFQLALRANTIVRIACKTNQATHLNGGLNLRVNKYYWLIGQTSQLSVQNKLLLYKTILKPIWTDGIQLWGCSKPSNTKILQAFQTKTVRLITNAPRYVNNQTLHTDISIQYINEVITTAARKSRDRNSNHHNPLTANLYNRPPGNRRLRRHWPEDLTEWTLESHQWMEPYSGYMPA